MPILPPRMGLKIMQGDNPTFYRDFAFNKTLDHGTGPSITFTRSGTATYFDSIGTLTTATANTPRFDHDPVTFESKGLLIEEGRTNSLRNSDAGGAVNGSAGTPPTNWNVTGNGSGITRTISTGSANGYNYIDFTYSGTPTSTFGILMDPEQPNQVVASQNQIWTSSVYIALISGSVPDCLVGVREALSDGTLVAISTTNFASSLTSALQRFNHTRTLTGATTVRVGHRIQVTATNGVAINFTLRIAAPQLELGSFATSYIPTTNAAVTRGADVAQVLETNIGSTLNDNEGTLFFEGSRYFIATSNYDSNWLMLLSSSNSSQIVLQSGFASPSQQRIQVLDSSGVQQAIITAATGGVVNTIYRVIGVYKTNDFMFYQNGVAGTADTSGSGWGSLNRIRIGNSSPFASTGFLNGYIRKVGYWPKRLPNARLQAISA